MVHRQSSNLLDTIASSNIIFILGRGGCGKSVLMAQLTEKPIIALENQSDFEGFVAAESCHSIRDEWLDRKLGAWASRGTAGNEKLDKPIDRLSIANPTAQRLIWIGLDGLDERFPEEAYLQNLINIARSRRDVCLIFTCRKDSLSRVSRYLYRSETGYSYPLQDDPYVRTFELHDFEESEMLDAIELGVGRDARDRVERALSVDLIEDYGMHSTISSTASLGLDRRRTIADLTLTNSLKHPRMLGAFVHAVRSGDTTAESVLDGDEISLRTVGSTFLRIFLEKYDSRRFQRSLPEVTQLIDVLTKLAEQNDLKPFSYGQWTKLSLSCQATKPQSDLMLEELQTGGLIDSESPDRCIWRHPFVVDCLINVPIWSYWND